MCTVAAVRPPPSCFIGGSCSALAMDLHAGPTWPLSGVTASRESLYGQIAPTINSVSVPQVMGPYFVETFEYTVAFFRLHGRSTYPSSSAAIKKETRDRRTRPKPQAQPISSR